MSTATKSKNSFEFLKDLPCIKKENFSKFKKEDSSDQLATKVSVEESSNSQVIITSDKKLLIFKVSKNVWKAVYHNIYKVPWSF